MSHKLKRYNFRVFIRRVHLFEILLIILLSHIILNTTSYSSFFYKFLHILPAFCSYDPITSIAERFDWRGSDDLGSFIEKNLDIDYSGDESISGRIKAFWPDGDIQTAPTYLIPKEEKPYYLFNIDIAYQTYNLRLFRKFTKGNGTPEFAESHKEIKGIVFYQKDFDKLKDIKRKVRKVILQDDRYKIYVGNCTVNNGIWRLYKTDFRKKRKYWKFIPSDSSDVVKYDIVSSVNGFGPAHYLELPEIIGKPSFSGTYAFSVDDVTINPLLPFEIVCDVKANYPGVQIAGEVGVYDTGGKLMEKLNFGSGTYSRLRGVWAKETSKDLSLKIKNYISMKKERSKYIYKLEKVMVCVLYRTNEGRRVNFLGFRPLGILLFDD